MIKIRIRNAGHEIDVRFPINESELLTKLAEIHAVEHENERLGSPAQNRQAQRYKEAYPPRTRIMLLSMGNDPNPVEGGTRGTVRAVDDETSLHISCKAIGEPNLIMFVAVFL